MDEAPKDWMIFDSHDTGPPSAVHKLREANARLTQRVEALRTELVEISIATLGDSERAPEALARIHHIVQRAFAADDTARTTTEKPR